MYKWLRTLAWQCVREAMARNLMALHKYIAVSSITFQISHLSFKFVVYSKQFAQSGISKEIIWNIPCSDSNWCVKGVKIENIIKNHVMTSSWRHSTIHENLPISNNLHSFNIMASLLWEVYDFEKCTFNTASRDSRWRYWSETSHIWCLPDS